ncbi:MAG: hypothetical protein H7138_04260 [Myxococcales bacterium]|nr:hypothetical protein [Myxococcales bacterium]
MRELGIPEDQAAAAELGFGHGVELGQVAFVAIAWAALQLADRLHLSTRITPVAVIAIGSLSMYWLFDRLRAVLEAT